MKLLRLLLGISLVSLLLSSCSRAPESGGEAPKAKDEEGTTAMEAVALEEKTSPSPAGSDGKTAEAIAETTSPETEAAGKSGTEHLDGRERDLASDILAMPEGEAQALALTELVRRWSRKDLDEAITFGEELQKTYGKNSDVRRAFYRGIADEMAKEYPADLLGVISDGLWWNGQ